jgi:predicted ABC-type ATPase
LSSTKKQPELRMRVFAGPNGSGKSTIIRSVREYTTEAGKLDFGIYVNADDLVHEIKEGLNFSAYELETTKEEFEEIALSSGLVNERFSKERFSDCFQFSKNTIRLREESSREQLAQIVADFLRKKLLREKKKFSFETVFSHASKIEIMREAVKNGYKVYLYFVSTNSPEINKYRVKIRVAKGGHAVPPERIESRYYRSLELLYEASQIAYQAFFFDNSKEKHELFNHFKIIDGKKVWDTQLKEKDTPAWFLNYYVEKVKRKR